MLKKPSRTTKQFGFTEFVVLVAAMMACQALAIDAMLPALPTIANALGVDNENSAQWIITAYIAGVGCGQLFWGMLSDRYGRRPVLLTGLTLYVLAALLCGFSNTFVSLLAWRFVHGLASASMVVSRSVIRDLYEGRQMARVMSLTFIVFITVPIIAPAIGQVILLFAPWRYLFVVFGIFAGAVWLWALLRLPETLHPEYRITLTLSRVAHATKRVLGDQSSMAYTLAMTVIFGSLLAYIAMVQQIFSEVFNRPGLMPGMFALCAAAMGVTSFVNSKIVERYGMRKVSQVGLLLFIGISSAHALLVALGFETLASFVVLQAATMSCIGLMLANFGTMAMEPMGAMAGIAASFQGFISTTGGALLGALIGRQFNNSTLPLAVGAAVCGVVALALVYVAEQGQLFRPHHADE
jgi:DHA1 family bicyclomycin/chloramphenicol resistance-like MFS transporter